MLKNKSVQSWARVLHIYISMALLMVVLFFVVTGITLNRAAWFVSDTPAVRLVEFTVPAALLRSNDQADTPNQLALVEFVKSHGGLSGQVSGYELYRDRDGDELVAGEISFSFKGPGYSASVFIDMLTGQGEVEEQRFGLIAVLNDLHKGRNSGAIWQLFIDISALLMLGFVLTGVCLLVPKKKSFIAGLKWCGWGSLATFLLYWIAVP
ncbi:PepSY-associated TM helix domain-containing protein [Motilimonas sp. 1_MG-2023]|uniref:PepSY-associated TM helix domain-containing protein n=1 Tax=Motilimonas TaxID=1914248 RepID=UPI0026E47919|nr:PepSY-associated TM helix domain-containing protein [Motilimonas sp. 1_MG-2023]MDO6524642.1 PepSY-associated TM helix domain-containing protein [Motilimonas sp. 1_MG-2023]